MILYSQDQFREDYIRPLYQGEKVDLPPGYVEKFALWKEANAQIFARLSPEEITKSFSLFLDENIKNELLKLAGLNVDMKNLAFRGQLLLGSKNQKDFKEVIKPEDIPTLNPTEFTLLSPTLRSTTTDLNEVMREQTALHAVKNLTAQGFFVNSTSIEDGIVNINVKTSKGAEYLVQINPEQDTKKPLDYTFINERGEKSVVSETQLPEKYNEISEPQANKPLNPALLGNKIALFGLDLQNQENQAKAAALQNSSALPENFRAPQTDVIQAKSRFEREKAGMKLEFERRQKVKQEIEEHNEEERRAQIKAKEKQAKVPAKKESGMGGAAAGALVGAAVSGAVAVPIVSSIFASIII